MIPEACKPAWDRASRLNSAAVRNCVLLYSTYRGIDPHTHAHAHTDAHVIELSENTGRAEAAHTPANVLPTVRALRDLIDATQE